MVVAFGALTSCRKEKENVIPTPATGDVSLTVEYNVDGMPLRFDSLMYTNAAGNKFSVTKVHYYLSRFKFYAGGQVKYTSDTIIYADGKKPLSFRFSDLQATGYDSVSFHIGLDEAQNISNSLPATTENVNMGWPDMMGGGYHFLKLEGHWEDTAGTLGYAMHIGNNGYLVRAGAKKNFTVKGGETLNMVMSMDIAEWFANPNTYDLAKDGLYSMGNAPLMKKLSENGIDVFSFR